MASVQMDGSANFTLNLVVTEFSTNTTTNTSVVNYDLYINPPGGVESYNLTSSNQSYYVKFRINGTLTTIASGNFTYDFRSPDDNTNKYIVNDGRYTITHGADGASTFKATAQALTTNSNIGDGTIAEYDVVLTDFSRVPAAPAAPTLASNSANPMAVDITSAIPTELSPAGPAIDDYNYRYSTDNTTWSAEQAMGVDRTETFTSTTPGLYYIQTRAHSSEGWGEWSSSSSITTFSGGKVWDGTAFVPGTAKVWDGTAWVTAVVKVWDGTDWTNAK